MYHRTTDLEPLEVAEIRADFSFDYGVQIPDQIMKQICDKVPDIADHGRIYGFGSTRVREAVANAVAVKFMGRPLPTSAEKQITPSLRSFDTNLINRINTKYATPPAAEAGKALAWSA